MSVKRYTGSASSVTTLFTFDVTDQYRDDLPSSVFVQLVGTWVGTVAFEGSVDGTNWYSLVGHTPATVGGALLTTATANGIYAFPLAGRYFRARVSAWTSGTVVAEGFTTYKDNTPWPSVAPGNTTITGSLTTAGTVQPIGGATTTGNTQSRINSAATTNATLVKASAGNLYSLVMTNPSAAVKYVKFYNKATAPVVGTDVPVLTFAIPAASTVQFTPSVPYRFATGIGFGITGLGTDADVTAVAAGDVLMSYDWA